MQKADLIQELSSGRAHMQEYLERTNGSLSFAFVCIFVRDDKHRINIMQVKLTHVSFTIPWHFIEGFNTNPCGAALQSL